MLRPGPPSFLTFVRNRRTRNFVARTGVEPVISTLRMLRPGPLDERATLTGSILTDFEAKC